MQLGMKDLPKNTSTVRFSTPPNRIQTTKSPIFTNISFTLSMCSACLEQGPRLEVVSWSNPVHQYRGKIYLLTSFGLAPLTSRHATIGCIFASSLSISVHDTLVGCRKRPFHPIPRRMQCGRRVELLREMQSSRSQNVPGFNVDIIVVERVCRLRDFCLRRWRL